MYVPIFFRSSDYVKLHEGEVLKISALHDAYLDTFEEEEKTHVRHGARPGLK